MRKVNDKATEIRTGVTHYLYNYKADSMVLEALCMKEMKGIVCIVDGDTTPVDCLDCINYLPPHARKT